MSCKNVSSKNAGLSRMIGSINNAISTLSASSKIGLALFVLFLIVAVFAGAVAPYDPWLRFSPFMCPCFAHLLGTNDLGNDILSELIFGTRVSLIVGFGAAFMATIIGTVVGLLSGYFRGLADELLMGLTDVFLMIPQIPLIIVLAAFL
ncbi:MAG: ABC transporter permease, partial [Methanothrix sp.]